VGINVIINARAIVLAVLKKLSLRLPNMFRTVCGIDGCSINRLGKTPRNCRFFFPVVNTGFMPLARILIVEDDPLLRSSLAAALEASGFDIRTSVATAREAVAAVDADGVDVALLDIDLGVGPTGVDVANALRKLLPRVGIVFLTSYLDPRFSRANSATLPVGSRYITKQDLGGITKVATTLLQAKYQPLTPVKPQSHSAQGLSEQQIEVLKLIAEGLNNGEIANRLAISEKGVEHLITRTSRALGVGREGGLNLRVQLLKSFARFVGKDLPGQ
jgi:DNA-binding NarL/FixJ family response regulator